MEYAWFRDRRARWKVGGLTIENNFFILKIEKRNKIIVFYLFLSRDFLYFIVFLTMAVHHSSNVILLAIEYSKGERQNIKLLSTQNNYSPSFVLKKIVIFFISSDKKLCRSWKYKTRCRTKRRGKQTNVKPSRMRTE